jgi:PAS domain S-box-containing protein
MGNALGWEEGSPIVKPSATEHVVVGGGEMGDRIRAFDWTATPLGPVERWPQSLRSAISILLPSKAQIVLFWGRDLIALYNDAYRPVFGAKHPWALGRPARECWSEVWDVLQPLFEGVMRTGEAFWAQDHPFVLERHGYPEETYFDVSYDPVRDETGGVGGVFCIVSETTGRVLGERRLRTLRELGVDVSANSDLDVVAHAAAVLAGNPADVPFALVFLLDDTGTVARLVHGVGIGRQDVIVPETLDLKGPGAAASILHASLHAGTAREAEPGLFVTRVPVPASPDRLLVLPLLSGAQPAGVLVAGLSRHLAFTGHYRDFFELVAGRISASIARVRAYEQERRRAEALAELDRAKTAFFSNISHEFRTPLTLLLGPLEDLLQAPLAALGPDIRDRIDVAHRNALRMLKLVNALLDFSRLESGRVQAVYEPTDLGAYTAELASAFRSLVERAGLRFVVDCRSGTAEAFVDRDMWEKIVFNLLSNAFKHTFAGEIRVAVRAADDRVELVVADTGTGIVSAELPHVFERFHRVQNARARTHEGTGIGLALVMELVTLHGGTVDVTSQVDRGTTFTVSVPKGAGHVPPDRIGAARASRSTAADATPYLEEARRWMLDEVDASSGAEARAAADLAGRRILLADDNADMRDYLRRLLSDHWAVEAVSDGAAALAAARDRLPDLVVADVMMPGLDGFQLLRALRSDPRTSTIPVLLLSARAGEESRIEGLDAGADDYLVKPFTARELVARVNAHLTMAQARRRFAVELENERAKLETVLRQMPAGVLIVDAATGQFVLTNDQAARILGIPVSSESTASFPEARVRRADGTAYLRDDWPFMRSLRTGEVVSDEEIRFVRGDGAVATLSVSSAPVSDGDGRLMAAVVVFQDVTDRLALLAREQAARAEADAANRAKDRFLAVLSHELRVPLTAIMGWSRMLRNPRLGDAERAHAISVIERNAERQAALVKDLLDISRIAAGKLELDRLPVDLVLVTRDALDAIKSDLDAKRLALATDLDPSTGEVFGDVLRLQQVVVNLLGNAAKFTPEGGRIDVRLARHGEMARLTVADTGEGIDPTVLPQIFEPFQQGEQDVERLAHRGLGLGLTIVRELVGLHGGTVRAESPGPGQGATFTVELPVVAVRVPPSRTRPAGGARPRGTGAGRGRLEGVRVLIVDDQQDARELVTFVLEQHGAQTRTAESAPEALDILREAPIDVIVSDLAMPNVDGYALMAAVRSSHRRPNGGEVRGVALTAYKSSEVRTRTVAAGFDAHATKPIDPDDLVELVARLAADLGPVAKAG